MTLDGFVINADHVMLGYRTAKNQSYGLGTLFRSTDLGRTWKNITDLLPDLLPNPQNNNFGTATNKLKDRIHTITAVHKAFIIIHGSGDHINLIRSEDAGAHWEVLPDNNINERIVLTSGTNRCGSYEADKLWASSNYYQEVGKDHTLMQSDDYGASWSSTMTDEGHVNAQGKFHRLPNDTRWNLATKQEQVVYSSDIINVVSNGSVFYGLAAPKENEFNTRLTARNLYTELVRSTDGGNSWQAIADNDNTVAQLHFVDCQGRLYANLIQPRPQGGGDIFSRLSKPTKIPPVILFRSSDGGNSWEPLNGFPDIGAAYSYQVGYDGRIYTFVDREIFRSTEMVCCASSSTPPVEETCEITMEDFPSLSPTLLSIPANTPGKLSTDIYVKKGDYVCVIAEGNISISHSARQVGQVTYSSGSINASPQGNISPGLSHLNDLKKYAGSIGQLILFQGGKRYDLDPFTLKGQDCKDLPDEWFMSGKFRQEYGDYFVAKEDGIIEFEINHTTPRNRTGQFDIEIYTLTQHQHKYRNCFNRCPITPPTEIADNLYIDSKQLQWTEKASYKGLTFDDAKIEACYHGQNEDYRAKVNSDFIKGSQCVYNHKNSLVNRFEDITIGTFDYGYYKDEGNSRLHFILDVFPHIVYQIEGSFFYAPTPANRIY